jgi:hypothetical protein
MADQSDFEIGLFPAGVEESGYHSQKPAEDEVQRQYLLQRGSDLLVKGRLVDVIHGYLKPGGLPATLIVAKFNFLGSTSSRRFHYAKISWEFYDSEKRDGYDPEVIKISLDGQFSMNESSMNQTTKINTNTTIGAGFGPANASIGGGWERAQSLDKSDRITLFGSSTFAPGNFGEPNGAMWVLNENRSQKNGIPDTLISAVLLRRKPTRKFIGTIQVKAKVDFTYDLRHGKKEDRPVRFDPEWESTSDKYTLNSLGEIDLDGITDVKFNNPLPTPVGALNVAPSQ